MTYPAAILAVLGVFLGSTSALAQASQVSKDEEALLQSYRAASAKDKQKILRQLKGANGIPQRADVALVRSAATTEPTARPTRRLTILNKNTPTARSGGGSPDDSRSAAPDGGPPVIDNGCSGLKVLLRQDWKDIGTIGCPETTNKAKGAELSFSYDRLAANRIWNLRGTAGVFYSSLLDTPGQFYKSFGAYVTVNRVLNSAPAAVKGDADKIAFGGAAETAIQTTNFGSHYFRLRGGVIEDRLKDTSSANLTGEWIPSYDSDVIPIHSPIPLFNQSIILRFDPVFLVQYNAVTGKNQTLDFNNRTQSLRIGPELTLNIFPGRNTHEFLSRFSGSVTYHWAYETFSSKGISWFDTSITYNIDPDGQFGITGSYKKGRDEDTGTLTDIYKIALTGKI